jgi:putative transposase
MSQRLISFSGGEFYHVYNRGTDKRAIYLDKSDYKRFIELLYLSNSSHSFVVRDIYRNNESIYEYDRGDLLVAIGAYCLMPNHFHILVTPLVENGISKFMNKLCTSYSMYFNKKYNRTGALFQGKFKAEHADRDEYLKYLYAYIHLNPVKLIDSTWKEEGIKDAGKKLEFYAAFE